LKNAIIICTQLPGSSIWVSFSWIDLGEQKIRVMKYIFALLVLSLSLFSPLQAATGTKDDPLPSDQTLSENGGPVKTVTYWKLFPSYAQVQAGVANFTFSCDAYTVPDTFDIYYNNQVVWSSGGYISHYHSVDLSVKINGPVVIKVVVNKANNPQTNTEWTYTIESRYILLTDLNSNTSVDEGDSAYITGDDPPLMPKLSATVRIPHTSSTVRWKLAVKYGSKVIHIPANGRFTKRTAANKTWNIYDSYVDGHGNPLGFFGGQATLMFQIDNKPVNQLDFRIRGTNPDDTTCRTYIDSLANGSAIPYAVAKYETLGICGTGSLYNQFYDDTSVLPKHSAKRKSGFPARAAIAGYGIFQLQKLPKPTNDQFWNWESNITEGIRRLTVATGGTSPAQMTALDVANGLLADLARTYPTAEAMPDVTYTDTNNVVHTLTALEATTLTAYDTFKGCPSITITTATNGTAQRLSCWTYDSTQPSGSQWTFHGNVHDFVNNVLMQME